MNNIIVTTINPKYTSQRCPIFGYKQYSNRDKRNHIFACKSCEYQSIDDRIGAINLLNMGIEYHKKITA